jgi:glycosyltransferase involved in cell wall biosynthesis
MPGIETMQAVTTALTFSPKRVCEPTGWVPHIPFAATLVQALRPKVIVELGTHSGNSYFSFCQAVEEFRLPTLCYAVDTWQGDAQAGTYDESVFRHVSDYNTANYQRFSYLLRMTFNEAVSQFSDESIDILHMDGLHTYEAVKQDFLTWLPKVRTGGIMLFHDVCVRLGDFGIWRFWDEIQAEYPHTLLLQHACGLGVLVKGGLKGAEPTFLHQLTEKSRSMFWQSLFAIGGERVLFMSQAEQSELMHAQLFVSSDGNFGEGKSEKISYEPNKSTVLRFSTITQHASAGLVHLRFDPIEQISDIRIKRISILHDGDTAPQTILKEYDLVSEVTLNDAVTCLEYAPLSLFVRTEDPQIHLAPFAWGGSGACFFEVEILADPTMGNMAGWLVEQTRKMVTLQKSAFDLERQLQKRDVTISSLQSSLEQQRKTIADFDARMNVLQSNLSLSREEALKNKEQLEHETNVRDTQIASLKKIISDQEASLISLTNQVSSVQQMRDQMKLSAEALKQELSKRDTLLAQIASLKKIISDQEASLISLTNQVSSVRQMHDQMKLSAETLRQELSKRDALLAHQEEEIGILRRQNIDSQNECERKLCQAENSLNRQRDRIYALRATWFEQIRISIRAFAKPAPLPKNCQGYIDIRPPDFYTKNFFTLAGWFADEQKAPARQMRAIIGKRIIVCKPSIRIDVNQHLGKDSGDPAVYGFHEIIKTGRGLKLIILEVETMSGHVYEMYRGLHWVGYPPSERYTRVCPDYETWLREAQKINPPAQPPEKGPLISIIMPVYNTPGKWLRLAIKSVIKQTYKNWELCIADDASTDTRVQFILREYETRDTRIKVAYRKINGHISMASNTALDMCNGEFTALLDHDDMLAPHALSRIAHEIINNPNVAYIYSDEDKIDSKGRRFDPYFKPDFLPDLLVGQNFLSHLSVIRTDIIRQVGGFRKGFEGSQDWDLALRSIEQLSPTQVRHIPEILYHWRAVEGSTALNVAEKSYTVAAAEKAIKEYFIRKKIDVKLIPVAGNNWRVVHPVPQPAPFVSLIVPTRNRLELVRMCVNSILEKSTYQAYEIIIVDNQSDDPATLAWFAEVQHHDSRVRVLKYEKQFNFSAINNYAEQEARGEIIGLINNDLELITAGWLEEMVSHAVRPEIGAVGAMLYYPNNTVQHAGVLLGVGGVANHAFHKHTRGTHGYFNRSRLVQNYTAVTAACLLIKRSIYKQVGGFNEEDLPVAFNDIDFCLRVREAGYLNLWTPFAEFYHHESASRGAEDTPEKAKRFTREVAYMRTKWGKIRDADPAYNPNFSLEVSAAFKLPPTPNKL